MLNKPLKVCFVPSCYMFTSVSSLSLNQTQCSNFFPLQDLALILCSCVVISRCICLVCVRCIYFESIFVYLFCCCQANCICFKVGKCTIKIYIIIFIFKTKILILKIINPLFTKHCALPTRNKSNSTLPCFWKCQNLNCQYMTPIF